MPFVFNIPRIHRSEANLAFVARQFMLADIGNPHTVEVVEHARPSRDWCMAFVHIDTQTGERWSKPSAYLRAAADPSRVARLQLKSSDGRLLNRYWILNESTQSRSEHATNAHNQLPDGDSTIDLDFLTSLSDSPAMVQAADEAALTQLKLHRLNCTGTVAQWSEYYDAEFGKAVA